ncbi:hypothetical protein J3R82DRAFT_1436 [Butyriboletus roseoflavus]|nr:hypothetical protein J3R82DRAFT_1436 [Butyriboletus roseoflavus]
MARVPISFYLNILAGILVLFNHYASSETGDVALNKVTGAAGRFYVLFRDTALTFQHGCTSRLEKALCGFALDNVPSHDAAQYLRVHFCHAPAQSSKNVGRTSNERQPHGGYGGSFASVYYRLPVWSLPRTSVEDHLRQSPFSLDWSSQVRPSQAVWDQSSKAMAAVGALLLRTFATWWWFAAPFRVTGVLLAAYYALAALGYLLGGSMMLRVVSQVRVKWACERERVLNPCRTAGVHCCRG